MVFGRCQRNLLLTLLLQGAQSRHQSGTFFNGWSGKTGKSHTWHFLSKFTFDKEGGHVAIRLKVDQSPKQRGEGASEANGISKTRLSMDFMMYKDDTWKSVPDMKSLKHCSGDPNTPQPDFVTTIDFTDFFSQGLGRDWNMWTTQDLAPMHRPHTWYFVLSDCEENVMFYDIQYEMVLQQFDSSEFGVERKNSLAAHGLALLLNILMAIWWYCRMEGLGIKNKFEVHPIWWILSFQFGCQVLGHFCHFWHLLDYRDDGVGNDVVDIVGECFSMSNQVLQVSVFITIAHGYELVEDKRLDDDGYTIWNIALLALGAHLMLLLCSRLGDREAPHIFHGHEGLFGWSVLTIRLIFYGWFISASQAIKSSLASQRLSSFMTRLQAVGTLAFLTYPVTFCILRLVADYWRHRVMQAAVMSVQFIVNIWLAKLFLDSGFFRLKWVIVPTGPNDYRIDATRPELSEYELVGRSIDPWDLIDAMPIGIPDNLAHEA
jgi:hypothetical protein